MIRIFLLRLLLAWWLIPTVAIMGMPLWYLLGGKDDAMDVLRDFSQALWYGGGR